jgi:dTDP-4-dehydrorhamnose 3,5-epimerase
MTPIVEPSLVDGFSAQDERGSFAKPYPIAGDFEVREIFWSRSHPGVIRGMHFQTMPHPIAKVVWVSSGRIVDVLVDVRPGETFGAVHRYELDAPSGAALIVPRGFAHGFQAIEPSIVNYAVDGPYVREHDTGIRWDSFGFDWPLAPTVISERDRSFVGVDEFRGEVV